MNQIKLNDVFYLDSENGHTYTIIIVNINDFREPSRKYACDVWDGDILADDLMFFGDDFFNDNKDKLRKE